MLLFALAAQFSPALPASSIAGDLRTIFSSNDFPTYLLESSPIIRTVYTRTTVRPDGSTESCVVEISSKDKNLDEYTCTLIMLRAKFVAARWIDGSPTYGVVRVPVDWILSQRMPSNEDWLRGTAADLELFVNQLPEGAKSIAAVNLDVAADENGRAVDCVEEPRQKSDKDPRFPELIPLACKQALSSLVVTPPRDPTGKLIRSVQNVRVQFKLNH